MSEAKVAKSTQRFVRVSPRKVKIVLDLIRGKSVAEARGILKNTNRLVCEDVLKILNRVAADAEHNFAMEPEKLYVSECYVGPGMTLKRLMPRGKGSADRMLRRTSHITLAISEKE
ncbi:MAG: 50S ribosomal protein L22 [Clostridia bacterium]|nr:50S ribosomal protein L22 [Clostridia bacterium]